MLSKLEKDKSIKEVLNKLFERFGKNNFYLTDYWDADLCAIGIKNTKDQKYLIYISTFNRENGVYFVEVEESTDKNDVTKYKIAQKSEEVSFLQISELVKKYLFLKPII